MITFIAVMVFINFILLCLNEYGSLDRAKNTITIMHRLKSESDEKTEELINDLRREIEELRSS
jgi:hypothetical protein|tara:strand:- start:186 stop:374 length:189 start_codon:yes stop_codon:yes gene_type:complete